MRRLLLATLLVPALAAAPAHAGCAAVTDPAGDVAVASGATAPDGHLDLRSVTFRPGASGLVVTFADTGLVEHRLGEWRMTFTANHTRLYVLAGLGMWVNAGWVSAPGGFHAGVVGRPDRAVTGRFDYTASTITVSVPYAAFGAAYPRAGTVVTDIAVESAETFLNAGAPSGGPQQQVSFSDTARAARLTVVRC